MMNIKPNGQLKFLYVVIRFIKIFHSFNYNSSSITLKTRKSHCTYLDKSELSGPNDSSLLDLKDVLARSSSDSVGLEISSPTSEPGSQTAEL